MVVAALGTSCSGDGSQIGKAALIERADAACKEMLDAEEPTEEAAALALLGQRMREMESLFEEAGRPDSDADLLAQIRSRIAAVVSRIDDGDTVQELLPELTLLSRDMQTFGFEVCGSG